MVKHPGYEFTLTPRDPSHLPKEFPKSSAEETCYFLESYRHHTLPDDAPEMKHIEEAMSTIKT